MMKYFMLVKNNIPSSIREDSLIRRTLEAAARTKMKPCKDLSMRFYRNVRVQVRFKFNFKVRLHKPLKYTCIHAYTRYTYTRKLALRHT